MRVFIVHDDGRESGPFSLEDLRDRVNLRMVEPSQQCRSGVRMELMSPGS